jgi:hypothetical protein
MTDNLVKIDNDELVAHYDQMLTKLNSFYKKGFFGWLKDQNPHMAKRLVILDEKINDVWEQCVKGEATFLTFKAGVRFYEDTVRKALKDYD